MAEPSLPRAQVEFRARVKAFVETSPNGVSWEEAARELGIAAQGALVGLYRDGEITRTGEPGAFRYFARVDPHAVLRALRDGGARSAGTTSPQDRAKISSRMKAALADPEVRAKMSARM
ncbi:MAG: hypothetical protein ACYDCK_01610, partial [Thermoplasmatota archaeon]